MVKIEPRCSRDEGVHFVTARGHWMPCCAVVQHREFFNTEEFNVLNNSDFHNKQTFVDWLEKYVLDPKNTPICCRRICGVKTGDEKKNFYRTGDDAIFIYRKDSPS